MADENNFQNRMGNPADRASAPAGQGPDPLAELARLIGQNDPFSEFGRDPRAPAPAPQRPMPNEQQLVGQPYVDARGQHPAAAYQPQQDAHAFAQATRDVGGHRDPHQMPAENEFYDEPETSGRGRGFVTLMAVIALALIGTVGAFGYRFIFSGSGSSAPPKIIRANSDPTKVPPPAASGEASPGKLAYDRVGDGNQGQRVVPREEQPVDPKDLARPNVTRNSPPAAGQANQWAAAVAPNLPQSSSTATVAQPSSAVLGEPKRVRTVPIRPEATEANMVPSSMVPSGSSPPNANASNSRTASGAANGPAFVAPPTHAPAASNQMAPPLSNAPLSLTDDIAAPAMPRTSMTPPPPAAQARQIPAQQRSAPAPQNLGATAPRQAPARPTQLASTAPAGGGYLVQVSSQRSEAEAQTALRSLQSKFPNVVGGQPVTIRRAELGERGTFYRAMVGPFASREQATQLCGNLKAAGGTCIVAGN